MSRVRVWYDDACDQIFISGEMHTFAPRSLVCVLNGGGSTILIQMRGSTDAVAGGRFSDFGNHDGLPFEAPEDAKAYLDGVFSREPFKMVITPYTLTNASSYAVNHGLAYAPRATVVAADGAEVDTDVSHGPGQTVLTFASPFTGTLYLG